MISIKISFYILLLLLTFHYLTYPQDSLIIDDEDYRLFYVGETASKKQLKSKFVAFTIFVNIPIDSSFYIQEYPNPFSPPGRNEKFIYQLSDTNDIQINLVDTKDSNLVSINLNEQIEGYYYFIFKSNYFDRHSLNIKIQSSFENYRIIFVIKDEEYIFPLRTGSN